MANRPACSKHRRVVPGGVKDQRRTPRGLSFTLPATPGTAPCRSAPRNAGGLNKKMPVDTSSHSKT